MKKRKKKYPLTFAEAFLAMRQDYVVANAACPAFRFKCHPLRSQQIICKGGRGFEWEPMRLIDDEIIANWRIVPTKGHPRA